MAATFTLGRYEPSQQILNILDVTLGMRNDFQCADCGKPIVCVLDVPIRTRHFRHKKDLSKCKPGLETLLHKTAKEILSRNELISLPGRDDFAYAGKPEVSFSKYRPDVTLYGKEKNLLVEIEVSHLMTYEKHLEYQQLGADCLVIDLTDYPKVFHVADLERELIEENSRKTYYGCLNSHFKSLGDYKNIRTEKEDNGLAKVITGAVIAVIGYVLCRRFGKDLFFKKRKHRY
ncbi:hypothetical protein [Pedobacter gandavensis]|uniref:hypothetical protein n=1 Tax=Pedobacter gandavensis TaxID=2679963 RepID=UPI0029318251|nr:hypothetical protein [Pedobacter gandavensis]